MVSQCLDTTDGCKVLRKREWYICKHYVHIYFSNVAKVQELASERGAGTTSYIASQVFWSMSWKKNMEC